MTFTNVRLPQVPQPTNQLDELKYATKEWLTEQAELFYFTGIEKLQDRNKLCIDKGSDSVEK